MAPTIDVNEVAEGLWVGPCPATTEFIHALRDEAGVTGLVSLQTDGDLRYIGLSWDLAWGFLMRAGIAAERIPIEDLDVHALAEGLPQAIDAVHRMRSAGRVTYLHCTAGLNRSPTVAIGYLVEHGGLPLDQAWSQVKSRRRTAPHREALDVWLARR